MSTENVTPAPSVESWTLGLLVAIIGGLIVTATFHWMLGRYLRLPPKESLRQARRVPPSLTGIVERLFFAVLVGFQISGAPTAMIAWIALKLATNWNNPKWNEAQKFRAFAFRALLTGLVSMLCAFVGGMIAADLIHVDI
jgi:sterol desaturase/sphingolipid hydroxylase (fatty acid hydroxylase superfamily)